jgi:hypothetical protein
MTPDDLADLADWECEMASYATDSSMQLRVGRADPAIYRSVLLGLESRRGVPGVPAPPLVVSTGRRRRRRTMNRSRANNRHETDARGGAPSRRKIANGKPTPGLGNRYI